MHLLLEAMCGSEDPLIRDESSTTDVLTVESHRHLVKYVHGFIV